MDNELYRHNADRVTVIEMLDSAQEECAEMIQAISKVKRASGYGLPTNRSYEEAKDELIEEIAHVMRSCDCVIYKMKIDIKDIFKKQREGDEKIKARFDKIDSENLYESKED